MTDRGKLLSFTLLLLTSSMVRGEAARCPANSAPLQYHSLQHAQIATSVNINGSGPYEFMVDTGAQLTIIEPALASELWLQASGSIGVISVTNYANAPLVSAAVVEAGRVAVRDVQMVVERLDHLKAENPGLRGILGNNFLSRFDLLIDNRHKILCLDETRQMQQSLRGEHISIQTAGDRRSGLLYTQPVLVSAHLTGDGPNGTVLLVDSGSSAPVLFGAHVEVLPWLQKATARRGGADGGADAMAFATLHPQAVRIGTKLSRQITFLTPINSGRKFVRAGEDGLLPTSLFGSVFISYSENFVIFEPRVEG